MKTEKFCCVLFSDKKSPKESEIRAVAVALTNNGCSSSKQ